MTDKKKIKETQTKKVPHAIREAGNLKPEMMLNSKKSYEANAELY